MFQLIPRPDEMPLQELDFGRKCWCAADSVIFVTSSDLRHLFATRPSSLSSSVVIPGMPGLEVSRAGLRDVRVTEEGVETRTEMVMEM